MIRDSDIVKALGYVALYAAYVEESVDVVMERLVLVSELNNNARRWSISQKVNWCIETLESLHDEGLGQLISLLYETNDAFRQRNEIIHGRIYAGNERSDILKSGRAGVHERAVTANELYDLAEKLFSLQAAVPNVNYFATFKAIEASKSTK
jgi:hypothetical protein